MSNEEQPPTTQWLRGYRLLLLTAAFALADLTTAIDDSILAVAIPHITTQFRSTQHLGWYGSAYLLGQMSTQPLFGRIYLYFEAKATYLVSLYIFVVGSVVSAAAPNSLCLILGRVVCGCGAAGMLTGSLTIFGEVVPMRIRPQGLAIVTAIESLGMMLGSTVGGLITDSFLTWRFCFWINVPIGVVTGVVTLWILEPKKSANQGLRLSEKLSKLDPLHMVPLTFSLVLLFLALETGGTSLPWSDARVWCSLVGAVFFGSVFGHSQYRKGDAAALPPRILTQRTVAACCAFSFLYGAAIYTHVYMLPLYFQGVLNATAAASSIYGLTFAISETLSSIVYGIFATRTGHFMPFIWIGSVVYVIGSILLSWLSPHSSSATFLGYQVVSGIGLGLSVQVTFLAVQVVLPHDDRPTACSIEVFSRDLGGSIGFNIAQNIMRRSLRDTFSDSTARKGILELSKMAHKLPMEDQERFAEILNHAIMKSFNLPIVATVLAVVAGCFVERKYLEDDTRSEGYKALPEDELELAEYAPPEDGTPGVTR